MAKRPCRKHAWYEPMCWRCRAVNPPVYDGTSDDV